MKRYIITGTPGCGKTSVIRALELTGECVVIPARPIDERVAIILRGINEKMLSNE